VKTIILLGGLYNFGLAIFHLFFWKIFNWGSDLKKLSFANRAIMQILNVQVIVYFVFTGVVCFVFPTELLHTKLGTYFLGGTSLFWFVRTIQQFIFLNVNQYKIHILTLIFLIGTILFALPVLIK